jgi:alpha-D-xyloside xylohydrolase
MPYLWQVALEAHREGVPMMRAMLLEFPEDPACETLDRQYLRGGSLLVAPIFAEDGIVDYYLPAGRWTNFLTGQVQEGPVWRREQHGFLSLPLMVRPNSIIPLGAVDHRPDYDYAENVTFRVGELSDGGEASCQVSSPKRVEAEQLIVRRIGQRVTATLFGESSSAWRLQLAGISKVSAKENLQTAADPFGIIIQAPSGGKRLEFEI